MDVPGIALSKYLPIDGCCFSRERNVPPNSGGCVENYQFPLLASFTFFCDNHGEHFSLTGNGSSPVVWPRRKIPRVDLVVDGSTPDTQTLFGPTVCNEECVPLIIQGGTLGRFKIQK